MSDSDRTAWIGRVIERDPALAAVLREFGSTFQARVMRLHHADPDLCWQDEGEWASDGAIHPVDPIVVRKS